MKKWQNHYSIGTRTKKLEYEDKPTIPTMVLEGSRLAHLLKKNPCNNFFTLNFNEKSRFNSPEKVLIFWQYVGNNILTIKSIANMDLDNALIIIDDAYEGLLTESKVKFIIEFLEKVTDNILIITSNENLYGKHIQYIDFHIANRYYDNIDVQAAAPLDNKYNRSKKFLCLNNLPRLHRLRMVDFILENNIDTHTYLSCSKRPVIDIVDDLDNIDHLKDDSITYQDKLEAFRRKGWLGSNPINFEFSKQSKNRLEEKLPLNLDMDESTRGSIKHFTPKGDLFFNDSYWSIVNERDFFETEFRGYTEKVLKCFYFKHPFIVCGLPFTLKKLQSLGFMTFGHIIDESYDQEKNNEKRFDMVCKQILHLHKMNYSQHFSLREKLQPVLNYNQQLYQKLNKNFVPNKVVIPILEWHFS